MENETNKPKKITLRKRIGRKTRHRSTSVILQEITRYHDENLTIRDLSAQLGDRGFGIILLLFSLPNTIPLPIPGVSTITSVPLIFFAAQLFLGRERIWLPGWLALRQIPMAKMRPFIQKSLPFVIRLEKIVKPRLDKITTPRFDRFAGFLILTLAILIALPIPLGNLPLGIAMAVLALAITESDGIVMIVGWLLTIAALCFFSVLISGYVWIIWNIIRTVF